MVARKIVATASIPNDFMAIGMYNICVNFSKFVPSVSSETW